jgi:hypothetical protein
MGDAAASALLASSSATGLSTLEELLRTFRAASARGETASLHSKNGMITFTIGKRQPAAAPPASRPPPPAGRRKAPRSRGSLLRDERRRLLKIATDVFDWKGRCPLYTVHRPAIPASALVSGQKQVMQQVETPAPRALSRARARGLARYDLMVLQCKSLVLKLPPVPPPAPQFQPARRPALRLRTKGRDIASYFAPPRKCSECDNMSYNFYKEGWEEFCGCDSFRECAPRQCPVTCTMCHECLKILHKDPNYVTPVDQLW